MYLLRRFHKVVVSLQSALQHEIPVPGGSQVLPSELW